MKTQFGNNLRALRKARDMTQEELADLLGVSFQAVSKWERNENFPDILTLPKIAALFGITTDHLLGVDSIEQEQRIQTYIDEYSRLWAAGDFPTLSTTMKEAVHEFPGEWRLTVRHFNVLTAIAIHSGASLQVRAEAEALYRSIQDHCMTDSIRIWSQKIMANYYRKLAEIKDGGVTMEDIKTILENMPLMQNGRDLAATFLLEGEEKRAACANALCELTFLFDRVIMDLCETYPTAKQKVDALLSALTLVDAVFPNGDYGKCTPGVTRTYRLLLTLYCELGQQEEARKIAHHCADASAAFDAIAETDTITHTSPLVEGLSVVKHRIPYRSGETQTEKLIATLRALGHEAWLDEWQLARKLI